MAQWTTADLLASVTARANFPDATKGSLSPASLLNFATEELHLTLVPMILACREKYYETYQDFPIVNGVATYAIPTRAIGGVLSAVQYVYGQTVVNLTPLDPSQVITTTTSATPRGFYYENNNVHLDPTPSGTGGTLRMRYFQRPSRLEQTINCAQITAVDPVGMTVTCSSVPSTWGNASVVDFVPSYIPYTPYGLNTAVTGIASGVVSFVALPKDANGNLLVKVGDWLALAEYTPIPEVPFEFQPYLAQATVCKGLEATGDSQGLANATAKLDVYRKSAVSLITPRDQSGPKKIVSRWGRF